MRLVMDNNDSEGENERGNLKAEHLPAKKRFKPKQILDVYPG